jgi:hypothetical protein
MLRRFFSLILVLAGASSCSCDTDSPSAAPAPTDAGRDTTFSDIDARDANPDDVSTDDSAPSDAPPSDSGGEVGDDAGAADASPDGPIEGECQPRLPHPKYPPLTGGAPVCSGLDPSSLLNNPTPAGPHRLYPALRVETLPLFGTAAFTYEVPMLPATTRVVIVDDAPSLANECANGEAFVNVIGDLAATTIASSYDCDVVLGPKASIASLTLLDSRRVRVRGGKVGYFVVQRTNDVVIDGVTVDSGAFPEPRPAYLFSGDAVDRLAILNVLGRAVRNSSDNGAGFWVRRWQNVLVAKSNFATDPDTTGESWFARIEAAANWLFVDVQAKVFRNRLLHLGNDQPGYQRPISYLVVRGGAYMNAGELATFVNSSRPGETCVDGVFLEGVSFFLDAPAASGSALGFGESSSGQLTFRWDATDTHWHTRSCAPVSSRVMNAKEALAGPNEALRYQLGEPRYFQHPNGVPYPEWQAIAGITDSNPEHLVEQ